MFRNYIIVAIRNLIRQKLYSLINILGLAIGIALFVMIALFIADEFNYDRFNLNYDRIYRLEHGEWCILGPAYGPLVQEGVPQILATTRVDVAYGDTRVVRIGEKLTKLEKTILVDTSFFDIFTFEFISGDPATALQNPYSILLSEEVAGFLYGDENPVGQTLRYDNRFNLQVTGVYRIPGNFHLTARAIAPFELLADIHGKDYMKVLGSWNYNTYVLLPEIHDKNEVESEIRQFFYRRFEDQPRFLELVDRFHLRPFGEIYFAHHLKYEMGVKHGNISNLRIFMIVAVFILLLACINFINLSTARGALRAKEVGLRKVIGSHRRQLILQFLAESVVTVMIALFLALLLSELLLPEFNKLSGSNLAVELGGSNLLIAILLSVLLGIAAGFYPAFYLTAYNPITVLRGEKNRGKSAIFFRRILIVLQFAISIVLVIGTLTVQKQLMFMKNKDLGFRKDHVIWFRLSRSFENREDAFRQTLLQYPYVKAAGLSYRIPGEIGWQETIQVNGENRQFTFWPVTAEYLDMMGIEFAEGRNFDPHSQTDRDSTVILNEEAVRFFGFENPLQEKLKSPYINGNVIGVVKDFHFNSVQHQIGPLVMCWRPGALNVMNVRFADNEASLAIAMLEKEWQHISPDYPFEYAFLDDSIEMLYGKEEQFGKSFMYFSILAIFIACLGLFGLASFTTVQRTREIGVRKVFGAEEHTVVMLLVKDFMRWVLIANLIAWPVAWLAAERWLETFSFRIVQSPWIYVAAGLLALSVAVATVSAQALRAARANPVDALKYE